MLRDLANSLLQRPSYSTAFIHLASLAAQRIRVRRASKHEHRQLHDERQRSPARSARDPRRHAGRKANTPPLAA